MKDRPASSQTVRKFREETRWVNFQRWGERITTYTGAVNHLLASYATDSYIQKAKYEIAALRNAANETLVQFVDVLRTKFARCENAYPEEVTKSILIDGLPENLQSAVRMFWGCEQNAHLLEIAQNADKLLVQTLQVLEPARVA